MSTPSLLNIPYLYKAGTLYSQIPESGAGDFTVSRTTTVANRSTRINKDGFIELVADNVPRLDYPLGGAVNGCPALLVEPSAKNDLTNSETFENWGNIGSTTSINVATSPDGTTNADEFIGNGTNTSVRVTLSVNTTAGAKTFSCFLKAGTVNFAYLAFSGFTGISGTTQAYFDLINGTTPTAGASIVHYGNGWYRCSVGATIDASDTNGNVQVLAVPSTLNNSFPTAADANGKSILVWGAQLETGSVATSYIRTTTAAVTRSAEIISRTSATALIGQTEGTMYWEGAINRIDRVFFALSSGITTTQAVRLQTTGGGLFQAICITGTGTIQCNIQASGAVNLGEFYKIAFAYKENDFVLYINGTQRGTDTSGTLPTNLNSIYLCNSNGTEITDERIRAVELHPNRLSNAQLAALTAL